MAHNEAMGKRFDYETVTGFFRQDDPATDPATFDYVSITTQRTPTLCFLVALSI